MSEMDRLLDQALASYAACEPRPGLTGRVLARVESEAKTRRPRWWGAWAFVAVSAVACVVVWPRAVEPLQVLVRAPDVPMDAMVVRREAAPMPVVRVAVARRPREQRALVTLARIDGDTAQWLQRSEKPLEVAPLAIRPLQVEGLETGEETR